MNKIVIFIATFAAVTCLSISLRNTFSSQADASRSSEGDVARTRQAQPRNDPEDRSTGVEGAALPGAELGTATFSSSTDKEPSDVMLARQAYDSGVYLLNKARRTPENPQILQQAAQHLRACLLHESTARDAGTLFEDARRKLEEVERQVALGVTAPRPTVKPATTPAPALEAVVKENAPTPPPPPAPAPAALAPRVEPREEEAIMVGPDGVRIRREKLE